MKNYFITKLSIVAIWLQTYTIGEINEVLSICSTLLIVFFTLRRIRNQKKQNNEKI
jgi:hypothetical protein